MYFETSSFTSQRRGTPVALPVAPLAPCTQLAPLPGTLSWLESSQRDVCPVFSLLSLPSPPCHPIRPPHRGTLQPASQANTTSFPTSRPSRPSRQHSLRPRGMGGPLHCGALCHLLACVGSSLFCFEVCLCACACRRQEVISAALSWKDANEALMSETRLVRVQKRVSAMTAMR